MEISGIEPEASCMQSKHSTTELYPQRIYFINAHGGVRTRDLRATRALTQSFNTE
ncbi:hypothetical protein U3516DRAFT_734040 [Neocallimastix sp. 'constans']